MSLDELVSDWELDEIRHELVSGVAPDIVAFWHGVPTDAVRSYRRSRYTRRPGDKWTDAEIAFVKDNYPNHGRTWAGWKILGKTWESVRRHAYALGVKKKASNRTGEGSEKEERR